VNKFQSVLCDYVQSGHALLNILTPEKDRARREIIEAAKDLNRSVFDWSVVSGWRDQNGKRQFTQASPDPRFPSEDCDPFMAVNKIADLPANSLLIMRDFGTYLSKDTFPTFDQVIALIDEIREGLSSAAQCKTIIFLGPELSVPIILRHAITDIVYDLPAEGDIETLVRYVCEGIETPEGTGYTPDETQIPSVVRACKGMTQLQVIDRVALAMRRCKNLDQVAVRDILHEKAGVIKASGLLTYREPPPGGLSSVGGLEGIKAHVDLDKPCFGKKAEKFGLNPPKGVLLVGIPGCGKTLCSIAIASEFGFPLIGMDVGDLMSKYVGESESNMSEAIRILEAIAPCVLQLDEIEKGFGGGDLDGGASQRVFGKFLKWLNDRVAPVYVVATANDVTKLPPEFGRKGRFDEIFGVDLPNITEREQIIRIHIAKRNRKFDRVVPDAKSLGQLLTLTDGYTGADIESVVILAMKLAFRAERDLSYDDLAAAVGQIVPLSRTEPGRLEHIRGWCATHAKPATVVAAKAESTDVRGAARKVVIGKNRDSKVGDN
jgi:ATP-dependent 26S proteasome regulatory subunit